MAAFAIAAKMGFMTGSVDAAGNTDGSPLFVFGVFNAAAAANAAIAGFALAANAKAGFTLKS